MAIQDDKTILSKADLKEYHNRILPYLGGNMMMSTNNSDYYSTDEKVVGVWTDGKPLYQKTYTVTTPALNVAGNVGNLPANVDKVLKIDGIVYGGDGTYYYYTPANHINADVRISTWVRYAEQTIAMSISMSIYANMPAYLTIQYTKTTDAAGSATTTPGAYDINFPNTWPANKEIFFGNGVYGQRFTGTITVAKNTPDNTVIMTGLQNGSIINWGGNWIDADGNQMGAGGYKGDTVQSLVQLNKTNLNGQLFFSTNDNTGARTNAPYDIWVTYTK